MDELEKIVGWRRTLKFAFPSIVTMLFISSYSMVDGAFVSNLISTDALASLNIVMPLGSVISGVGFMLSTGGSAYVATLLGKGERERARGSFTTITLFSVGMSLVFMILGIAYIEPLSELMGADGTLLPGCVEYGRTYLFFLTFLILQFIFTQMLIVAGHPTMSLVASVGAGAVNIVLDYLFIGVMDMGLTGAAVASGVGSLIPSVFGTVMFMRKGMTLRFSRPLKNLSIISSACLNGISEMASELSAGIATLLYNLVLMEYIGPDGVSAITIMLYVQFFAIAVIIGYSNGVAPVMSYNHGKRDRERMKGLYRTSMRFILVMSVAIFVLMELFCQYVIGFFAEGSESVMGIAVSGARIFSFAFLLMGFNVYASSLFTSLSNGPVSALISIVRSLLLLAPLIVLLPFLFGIDAIWFAVPVTEFLTVLLSVLLMLRYGKGYGYL